MSIQNNTTQLRAEQTELQSLLDAVNALPEAGNGGGSGPGFDPSNIQPCNVEFEFGEGAFDIFDSTLVVIATLSGMGPVRLGLYDFMLYLGDGGLGLPALGTTITLYTVDSYDFNVVTSGNLLSYSAFDRVAEPGAHMIYVNGNGKITISLKQ